MELEIHVDRDRCIGSGQCVWVAPGVLDQDQKAISVVVDPRGEPEERVVRAVTSCPVEAISLRLGSVGIGARDLLQWQHGVSVDDPLVEQLIQLSEDHERLRDALAGLRQPDRQGHQASATPDGQVSDDLSELLTSLTAHLGFEDDHVYPALTNLLDSHLVEAFDADHARMKDAAGRIARALPRHAAEPCELAKLAQVIEDHIRIEETVLFPLALGALHRATTS